MAMDLMRLCYNIGLPMVAIFFLFSVFVSASKNRKSQANGPMKWRGKNRPGGNMTQGSTTCHTVKEWVQRVDYKLLQLISTQYWC